MSLADVARRGLLRGDILRLVTNEGVHRNVTMLAGPGHWKGRARLTRPSGPVRCHVGHAIDYTFDFIRLSVPRSCVGNPRSVRLGPASVWLREDQTGGDHIYADDAQVSGSINANHVVLSKASRRD